MRMTSSPVEAEVDVVAVVVIDLATTDQAPPSSSVVAVKAAN